MVPLTRPLHGPTSLTLSYTSARGLLPQAPIRRPDETANSSRPTGLGAEDGGNLVSSTNNTCNDMVAGSGHGTAGQEHEQQ